MLSTLRRDHPAIVCEVLDVGEAQTIETLLTPLGYAFFLLTAAGAQRRAHIEPDPVWRNYIFRVP
jgi:hypothetical protein